MEAAAVPTVSLVNLRPRIEQVGVPRAAYVRFPRGANVGPPHDVPEQLSVLRQALSLLQSAPGPRTIEPLNHQPPG